MKLHIKPTSLLLIPRHEFFTRLLQARKPEFPKSPAKILLSYQKRKRKQLFFIISHNFQDTFTIVNAIMAKCTSFSVNRQSVLYNACMSLRVAMSGYGNGKPTFQHPKTWF